MQPQITYLPMDRRQALVHGTVLPVHGHGAALFADISGFTPLATVLAEHFGPQQGAEELTHQINQVYELLIHQVHQFRGSVIGFVGDAITCWFDADNGTRATACALAMQHAMREHAQVHADDVTVAFSVKIGIASGLARRFQVGNPEITLIDVLAGGPLHRMSLAEGAARKGEVVLDAATANALAHHIDIAEWRPHPLSGGRFAVITQMTTSVSPTPWPSLTNAVLPDEQVHAWMLPPVYARLHNGQGQFLAELRPAVSLFLKFEGLDYDHDPTAGDKLDAYIRWVQQIAQRYDGNLIQLTIGDKGSFLYIAFGAPVAHDDDAVRAVRVSLELIAPPPALHFITGTQIGLAQGQARVGAYGSATRRSYGVIGDDAVLAARLMAVAPPGEIRCAHSIFQQTSHHIAFERLMPVRVKGRAEPIRVYRPTDVKAEKTTNDGSAKAIVGREIEVARLTAILGAVLNGKSRTVVIEGEAGIGKSRLAAELTHLIVEQGHAYLLGAGQSIEQQTPYRAWRDIFNFYFAINQTFDAATRRQKVLTTIQQTIPEQLPYAPLLNDLLNLDLPANDLTAALEPAVRQHTLSVLVTGLLLAWAKERPLFLILEDAHWLDSLSWQLVEHVAQAFATSGVAFLLVVITRRMDQHSSGAQYLARLQAEKLTLPILSDNATVALVTARLGLIPGDFPATLATLITKRAEGNPFFAEELIFALRDQGLISVQLEEDRVRCVIHGDLIQASRTLPNTIHGLVLARIDQLPPDQQLTLKVAAVIGRTFVYTLLSSAMREHTAIDDAALRSHLDTLDILDLTPLESAEPLTYIFKHIITQEAAYQTLLYAQRRDLHLTVAETIERLFAGHIDDYIELLAYHWERGEDMDKAITYLIRAGERARRAYANDTAIDHFRHALGLLEAHTIASAERWEFEAWRGLGRTYFGIPDMTETEQCFRKAIALGKNLPLDIDERGRLYHWLGETLWWQNRSNDQVAVGMQALALLGDNPAPSEALALANQTVAVGHIGLGGMDQFFAYTARTASFLEQLPYSEELRAAFVHIVVACQEKGDVPGALRWLHALGERAAKYGDLRAVAEGHYLTGDLLAGRGHVQEAISRYQQALNLYAQIRDIKFQVWCLKGLGTALTTLGQLSAAAEYAGRALTLSITAGDNRFLISENYSLAGSIALAGGDLDKAENDFVCAERIFREGKSDKAQLTTVQHLAYTHLAAGKRELALKHFQKAMPCAAPETHIHHIVAVVSGLEATYIQTHAFRAFCRRYRQRYPEVNTSLFTQWFLEPAERRTDFRLPILDFGFTEGTIQNPKSKIQNQEWTWVDPLGDCSFTIQNSLIIHAANGRALWQTNQTAPRLVHPTSGDVIAQTACEPVLPVEEQPAIGGLVLWKDGDNFLRLDRGRFSLEDILFSGNLGGQPDVIGRGRLPLDETQRVFLRLERIGNRVHALCSADGSQWFTVRHIDFPVADPIQVGVFAVGSIDRTVYRGAYPDGTAIRFTSFQLWTTIQSRPE